MPLLPIGDDSLVYGSADAGKTVHMSDPLVNEMMANCSRDLHLAEHSVGDCRLHAAGDVEVHIGLDDNIYILDLARSFPPEHPEASSMYSGVRPHSRSIFFKVCR